MTSSYPPSTEAYPFPTQLFDSLLTVPVSLRRPPSLGLRRPSHLVLLQPPLHPLPHCSVATSTSQVWAFPKVQ